MSDELRYEPGAPLDRPRSSAALASVIVMFLLLLAGGAATYYFLRRAPAPPVIPAPAASAPGVPAAPPAAPPAARLDLPPLEQSDAFVREQLAAVGGAEWRGWLDSDGLARRFAAAIYALAEGKSPRRAIERPFLAGRFAAIADGDRTRIDPASYARYDRIADTFAALDAAKAGAAYRLLHPLLEEAWAEIGAPGETLDAAVRRAIDHLLAAPEAAAEAEVVLREGLYRYQDPELEALTPAQKHLLRMGPHNAAKVREALQRLRAAVH